MRLRGVEPATHLLCLLTHSFSGRRLEETFEFGKAALAQHAMAAFNEALTFC